MRKPLAVLLAVIGLKLAVGVPIAIGIGFDLDLGKKPAVLVGGMALGIGVMIWSRRIWKGGSAVPPASDPIPVGHMICGLCGQAVPVEKGVSRQINHFTLTTRVDFVCNACIRFRTRRALIVLGLFFAGLGVLALVVTLIPNPGKN